MADDQQIEGLPACATARPLGGAPHQEIEGLPEGSQVRPLNQAPAQTGEMSAAPSTLSRAGSELFGGDFPYVHPIRAAEELTKPIENYTQEGRTEHPVLSRIGDVT